MKRVRDLVALCERLIVDLRDVIAALEAGDADQAAAKFGEAARRMERHANELAPTTDSKEGQQ